MPVEIPLKLKYRAYKPEGKFVKKSSNSGDRKKDVQGNGHRRRSYGPWWWPFKKKKDQ